MTASIGRPSVIATGINGADPARLPSSLVAQLADALGTAEARCKVTPRITILPVTVTAPVKVAQSAAYINAESAPFLSDATPPANPPPFWRDQPTRHVQSPTDDHDDGADLPRFFDRKNSDDAQRRSIPARDPMPTLSPLIAAFGFVVGLIVILPTLWLASADKLNQLSQNSPPLTLTAPTAPARQLATSQAPTVTAYEIAERSGAEPSDAERGELAQAAFDAASRHLAVGDYIGARDQLRLASHYGEELARVLLEALE